jgi:hypothetical protein
MQMRLSYNNILYLSEARIIPIRQEQLSKACHPPDIMTATISLHG